MAAKEKTPKSAEPMGGAAEGKKKAISADAARTANIHLAQTRVFCTT